MTKGGGMALSKMDMNALSDAVDNWLYAYGVDLPKRDPQTLIMDGTQDEAVIECAATIVRSAGAEVTWD